MCGLSVWPDPVAASLPPTLWRVFLKRLVWPACLLVRLHLMKAVMNMLIIQAGGDGAD